MSDEVKRRRNPLTEETKKKISLSKSGRKQSDEERQNNSLAHKGKMPSRLAVLRAIEVNTGKPCSIQTRERISKANKSHFNQESVRREISERQKGDKANNWKGGITPSNKRMRTSIEYKLWREAVYQRDNWTCQDCGKRGSTVLHPHHVKPFADYPELRFAIDNGQTLCIECHGRVHNKTFVSGVKYA